MGVSLNREEQREWVSIPTFSLRPNRLSIYNTNYRQIAGSNTPDEPATISRSRLKNLLGRGVQEGKVNRFHGFKISEHARKNLIDKINWLYFMSKSKSVTTIKGAQITNFRINFITLTLPAKQVHTTAEITSGCFNQFLTEVRTRFNLENYVWRMEFQKNGNVHYHICTDVFLDYYEVLKIWNRVIGKLGYVQKYTEKHALMSLGDYCAAYGNGGTVPFDVLKKRYVKGRALGWKIPNSVDVKSVVGQKKIAFYISKYFGKSAKHAVNCNELDTEENSKGLRLWFCSRSLSRLKKIVDFIPAFDIDLLSIVKTAKDFFTVVHQYCTTFYFSFAELANDAKSVLAKILRQYAEGLEYKPAI